MVVASAARVHRVAVSPVDLAQTQAVVAVALLRGSHAPGADHVQGTIERAICAVGAQEIATTAVDSGKVWRAVLGPCCYEAVLPSSREDRVYQVKVELERVWEAVLGVRPIRSRE